MIEAIYNGIMLNDIGRIMQYIDNCTIEMSCIRYVIKLHNVFKVLNFFIQLFIQLTQFIEVLNLKNSFCRNLIA